MDFKLGSTIHVNFPTDRCILFDAAGTYRGLGKLSLEK